jgi:hypothetical protein
MLLLLLLYIVAGSALVWLQHRWQCALQLLHNDACYAGSACDAPDVYHVREVSWLGYHLASPQATIPVWGNKRANKL